MLSLRLLAYKVMHIARWLLERGTGEGWSLRRVREQVLKVGVRILRHARQLFLLPLVECTAQLAVPDPAAGGAARTLGVSALPIDLH